ncbi:DUF3077 domain-containing protein [Pseudomonas putida]|uniref:DUF3077 domain-containing protein n=1 Tax=Pseudomonas putida TaxID=303 RepID=A0A4D6XG30_PSEPU|nr:DUF3077 domain-containing protein [Pseudomonas putida]QCI11745.1 DUF3077 domain-containing protein [Pseudomonas putida]
MPPCKPSRIPPPEDPIPLPTFRPCQSIFTVTPTTTLSYAQAEAQKLMECARYLNQTGVLMGDRRMTEASYHISAMVKTLLDEIEQGMLPSRLRGQYYA